MSLVGGSLVAGRFVVEGLAGKGGMGEVFRSRDVSTGEPIALKLLHAHADAPEVFERFAREARLLSELQHPGIASYVAHGKTEEGRPYLAIEWLTGQDLCQRLARGPLGLGECVTLLERTADALAVAHRRGVVHRDIKPGNLFLRDHRVDRVTLLDFGIAREDVAATALTRTGHIIGTPEYMAPEQARGERELGPSADVFSLGCVLFECLTGRPPFRARDLVAVLAKILLEDAPRVEELRPETPPALSALLARMLDKDPSRRPADAAALLDELAALERPRDDSANHTTLPGPVAVPALDALSGESMQLVCVVLALPEPAPRLAELRTRGAAPETFPAAGPALLRHREALQARLTRLMGRIEWLADGSLAVVVPTSQSAIDQATQAARCALAIKEHWPDARVALAMGRGLLKERLPAGEAIDRATALLRPHGGASPDGSGAGEAEATSGVWLDELSARLLASRFELTTVGQHPVIRGEIADRTDASRPLLGKPTPCVGREQELSMLLTAIEVCVDSEEPSGALVLAPPGFGKSRLKHELLRRLQGRSIELEVLSGQAAPMSAGSPYGLLAEALHRLCDVRVGDPPASQEEKIRRRVGARVALEDTARVTEFIAALCGVAVAEPSALLSAARNDPKIMNEQVQRAFLELLGAECAARPCLLLLEDLHWGDAATIKLLDAALLALRGRPLFVLAFGRPEVTDLFPKLWEGRTVQRIRLPGLSRKAAERLITSVLGPEIPAQLIERLIEQAAGSALFLEELIRAAADGKTEERPETVLAMLQAKLSCLASEARRLLCAASVFGQTFWRGGVLALLGQEYGARQADAALSELVQLEIVEKQWTCRFPDETEYRFRHALVRDAAYGLLTEDDRRLGHRLAGSYVARAGERDPVVLAEHAYHGGDLEQAALQYLRAAEKSFQSDDHDALVSRVERGIACDPRGQVLGQLLALKLEVCLWRGGFEAGIEIGYKALERLPRGSVGWNRTVGILCVLVGNRSFDNEVESLENELTDVEPEPDAVGAYCTAAALMASTFLIKGRTDKALRLHERLDELEPGIPESALLERGHLGLHRASLGYMLGRDIWKAYEIGRRAEDAYAGACAWRWRAQTQTQVAMLLATLGRCSDAESKLRECLDHASRINDAWTLSCTRVFLARFLAERCAPEHRAEIKLLARQIVELGAMDGIVGQAHGALARVFMAEERLSEAREQAEKGLDVLRDIRLWRPSIYRTLIEILLRGGRTSAARRAAEEGLRCIESLGGTCNDDIPLRVAIAEAYDAAGDTATAREILVGSVQLIESRAAGIPDPAEKERYLEQAPAHARTLELLRAWR